MIKETFQKLLRGERILEEEQIRLLQWVEQAETITTKNFIYETITSSIRQLFPRVSDITHQLGLHIAGEFRSGNGRAPGDGFTGGRYGYPGFTYGGTEYFLVGVENDVLQVGLSLDDGKVYAGAGNVALDVNGIILSNTAEALRWEDASGSTSNIYMTATGDDALGLYNLVAGGQIRLNIKLTDTSTPFVRLMEDPNNDNVTLLQINVANSTPAQVVIGGAGQGFSNGILLSANKDGLETVFNDTSFDIDFRIESAANTHGFYLDAGAEKASFFGTPTTGLLIVDNSAEKRLEIGADHFIPVSTSSNPNVIFNETGADMDFTIKDASDAEVFKVDAGAGTVTIAGKTSGEYTPTPTGVTNVDSTSINSPFFYMRMDSYVLVTGLVDVDPTSAGTTTDVRFALPIASNIGAATDVMGSGNSQGNDDTCSIIGDATNNAAVLRYTPTATTNVAFRITFMYKII